MAPADVDTCMTLGAGHPMGPLALLDYVSLDVAQAIGARSPRRPRPRPRAGGGRRARPQGRARVLRLRLSSPDAEASRAAEHAPTVPHRRRAARSLRAHSNPLHPRGRCGAFRRSERSRALRGDISSTRGTVCATRSPLSSAKGTASTAAVYFELGRGKRLSRHIDSAEGDADRARRDCGGDRGKGEQHGRFGRDGRRPSARGAAVANAATARPVSSGLLELDRRLDVR